MTERSEGEFLSELKDDIGGQNGISKGNDDIYFPGDEILLERIKSGKRIDFSTALRSGHGNRNVSLLHILGRAFIFLLPLLLVNIIVYAQTGMGWSLSIAQTLVVIIIGVLWVAYIVGVNSFGIDKRVKRLLPDSLVFSGPTNSEINKVMDSIENNMDAFMARGGVYRKRLSSTMRQYGAYNAIVLNNQGLEFWATRGLLMKKTTSPWLSVPIDQIEDIDVVKTGVGALSDDEYSRRALKISTRITAPIVIIIDEKYADYKTIQLAAYGVRDKLLNAISGIKSDPSLYPRIRKFDAGKLVWWFVFCGIIVSAVLFMIWAAAFDQSQIDQYGFVL
jgi:hypothetical protein